MSNPQEFAIQVPSEDPKKKKEKPESDKPDFKGLSKVGKDVKGGKEEEGEELSEEDQQLKEQLELLVERLKEPDTKLYAPALEHLRTLIRTSTSSMTSVPKPLKFLRPHYPALQELYETWAPSADKSLFADILSVLAMTYSDTEPRGTLRYRLLSASQRPSDSPLADPGTWGHEYVRHLAAELGDEFAVRTQEELDTTDGVAKSEPTTQIPGSIEDLRNLAKQCATFLLAHNAEPDAVDLLEEMEIIHEIVELVDENTFGRVCQYMVRCVNLLPPPDDNLFLRTAHAIYVKHHKFPEALSLSIRLGDPDLVREDFNAPANPVMKRQLAFIIARSQLPIEWLSPPGEEIEFESDLQDCLYNTKLSEHFRAFGKEVGVEEAKSLEDVYKSHLENTRSGTSANIDSARGNLAGTFVNAFVNAGFGNDKLMVMADEGNSWIYKNKDHGMMSAAASLGLSLLWDTDIGISHIDKYTYSAEEHIKAGALFATGMLNSGVRTEADFALNLLSDYTENKSVPLKTSSFMGLALAYTGSHREEVLALLLPHISDDVTMEIASLASLALGFVFVGSKHGEVSDTILQVLMEKATKEGDKSLDEKWARFMALGLGLLYLGQQDASDATIETLKVIEHPISKTAQILVEACSFAGTGNVLKIQSMLHHCDEHVNADKGEEGKKDEPKKDDTFQAFAVIAISLIAMGEDIGAEMALRQFNHLMHYGDPIIRKAVPLAIGLVSASNPQLPILDTLSKYSHDNDLQVAINAIFAMGLVGAGTNNARLAQMLRQLAGYYQKEPDSLFMVRIAQGMVHMGKGTIGLNPFFGDRDIMSRPAVAGLLAVLTAFTDSKSFVLDKYHWMFYLLTPAMYPRFLITLDENLENKPVTVRVGQAIDVVGQAGKPRTISGFQTHQSPVRLGTTERAELATEEFIPYSHVLEGLVILKKNPGWEQEDKMEV
ncbi:26S proteasome regulatory subunit rpn-1 [Psilocybe cubensis]|uniref:26S proteasome regulatory subunit rpn-1 n=2 Tax=Psilocybe cubensis TaxID=181762 RepID=A0ACB8GRH4_PSICU|nr:26S proteasome regulatory subunit rpn-1 [Psilocybe cubensis]KAH9477972.1 26S proteasome regulatory subunit rpn-1 [Psilocybe cubensis]